MSSDYERLVGGGSVAPVLLILALLVQWQLLHSANPHSSRVVRPILATALVPLSVLVGLLTLVRATHLAA